MRITPISAHYYNNCPANRKTKPNFTAHPDFYKFNSTQSCYFRRGVVALSSEKYNDIENLFQMIFSQNKDTKKNMLIIGIGHSQEPFSYLATAKGILKESPLNKNVDLYTVDLQSKPELNELKMNAFCDLFDYQKYPRFAKSSFVKDSLSHWQGEKEDIDPMHYLLLKQKKESVTLCDRVNDEIFNFLYDTYNNPQKSRWDSRIQDVIKEYPNNKFKVISANNVLPYIISDNEFIDTIKHINRTLEPRGYFITDPYEYPDFIKNSGALDNFTKIKNGIYQKIY